MRPTSVSVLDRRRRWPPRRWAGCCSASPTRLLPVLPWSPVIVLAVLAVAEGLLAQNTSARIQRKPRHDCRSTRWRSPGTSRWPRRRRWSGRSPPASPAGLLDLAGAASPPGRPATTVPTAVGGLVARCAAGRGGALAGAGVPDSRRPEPDKDESDSDRPLGPSLTAAQVGLELRPPRIRMLWARAGNPESACALGRPGARTLGGADDGVRREDVPSAGRRPADRPGRVPAHHARRGRPAPTGHREARREAAIRSDIRQTFAGDDGRDRLGIHLGWEVVLLLAAAAFALPALPGRPERAQPSGTGHPARHRRRDRPAHARRPG